VLCEIVMFPMILGMDFPEFDGVFRAGYRVRAIIAELRTDTMKLAGMF